MTNEFKIALSLSMATHVVALLGPSAPSPVAFDVERAATSIELVLIPPSLSLVSPPERPQPESPPKPQDVVAEQADPVPQPLVSQEKRGAVTENLPDYFKNPPPVYPRLARERGQQGTVLLEVEVLSSGRCGTINILNTSDYDLLDEAAVRAVRSWVFRPARRWNRPVSFWVEIPITFRLTEAQVRD